MALEVWSEMQFYNNVQFDKNLIANGNSQFQKSTFLGKTIFRDSISAYTNIFVWGGIKSTNIVLPSEYNNYELDLDKITTTIDTDYYLIGGTAIVGDKLNYTNIRCIQVPSHILIEQELMKIDIDVPAATYKLQVTGTKTNLLGLIIYVNKEGNTIAKGETSIDKTFYITVDSTNPKITIRMATSDIIKIGQIFPYLRIEVLQRLDPPITFNTKEGVISSKRPESFDLDNLTMIRCSRGEPIYFDAEKKYIKSQFCIQLDSNNGAVTLRNTPDGTNETIYGGYVTLYRPTGMGSSETRLDTLYLDEYKNGNRSIGTALDDIESRLNDEGFKSGSFGTDDDHPSIFLDEHGNSINALKGSIHQSGALVEVIIDTANSDIQAFVDQYPNNYTCRLADKVKDWGGNWFTLKKPSAIRTDIQSSWTESYTIYINTPYNQPQFWVVTIKYPNQTNDTPTVTFTQGTTAIDRVTYNNTSFCWRTKY